MFKESRVKLTSREVEHIRSKSQQDLISTLLFALGFIGLPSAAIISISDKFIGVGLEGSTLILCAASIGAVGTGAFYYSIRPFRMALRRDLQGGEATILKGRLSRVVSVVPQGSWPCLVLAAGDETIVVAGGWWEGPRRRYPIIWRGRGKKHFPSTDLKIRFLPLSGKVLEVEVRGKDLSPSSEDRLLAVPHHGSIECRRYTLPLDQAVQSMGTSEFGAAEGMGDSRLDEES